MSKVRDKEYEHKKTMMDRNKSQLDDMSFTMMSMNNKQQETKVVAVSESYCTTVTMISNDSRSTTRIIINEKNNMKVLCKNVKVPENYKFNHNVISPLIIFLISLFITQIHQTSSSFYSNKQQQAYNSRPIKRPYISPSTSLPSSTPSTSTKTTTATIVIKDNNNSAGATKPGTTRIGSHDEVSIRLILDQMSLDNLFDVKQFTRFVFNEYNFDDDDKQQSGSNSKILHRYRRSQDRNETLSSSSSSSSSLSNMNERKKLKRRRKPVFSTRINPRYSNTTHLPLMLTEGSTQDPSMFDDSTTTTIRPPIYTHRVVNSNSDHQISPKRRRDDRARLPSPVLINDNGVELAGLMDESRASSSSSGGDTQQTYIPTNEMTTSPAPPTEDPSLSSALFQQDQSSIDSEDPEPISGVTYNETIPDDNQANNLHLAKIIDMTSSQADNNQFSPESNNNNNAFTPKRMHQPQSNIIRDSAYAADMKLLPSHKIAGDLQALMQLSDQSITTSSLFKNLMNNPSRLEHLLRLLPAIENNETQSSPIYSPRSRAPLPIVSLPKRKYNYDGAGVGDMTKLLFPSPARISNAPYASLGHITKSHLNNDNAQIYSKLSPSSSSSANHYYGPVELHPELAANLERKFYYSAGQGSRSQFNGLATAATTATQQPIIGQQQQQSQQSTIVQKLASIPFPYQTQNANINKTTGTNNLEKQSSMLNSQHVPSSAIKRAIHPIPYALYQTTTTQQNSRIDPPPSLINLVELNENQLNQPALNWLKTLSPTLNSATANIPFTHYTTGVGQMTGSPQIIPVKRTSSSSGPIAVATISRPLMSSMFGPNTAYSMSIPSSSTSSMYNRATNAAQHRIGKLQTLATTNLNSNSNYESTDAPGSQPAASSVSASDPMWSDTQNQEDDYQQAPQTIQITAVPNGVGTLNGWNGFNGVNGINGVNGWGNGWNGWAGGPFANGRPVVLFNQRQPTVGSSIEWRSWVLPVAAVLALPIILGSLFVPLFLKSVMFLIQILQMLGLLMPPGQLVGHLASGSHASVSG